jgi:hypothetical protein
MLAWMCFWAFVDGFRDATREERRLWAPPGEVVPLELPAQGGGAWSNG